MGSLSSRPKIPAAAKTVYVPAASPSAPVPVAAAPAKTETFSAEPAAAARVQSLLERGRGRFGTIQTSFRGLLGLNDTSFKKKTLLGE